MVTDSFKLANFGQRRLTYVVGKLGLLNSPSIVLGTVGVAGGDRNLHSRDQLGRYLFLNRAWGCR
jgi:hypothetical protein